MAEIRGAHQLRRQRMDSRFHRPPSVPASVAADRYQQRVDKRWMRWRRGRQSWLAWRCKSAQVRRPRGHQR